MNQSYHLVYGQPMKNVRYKGYYFDIIGFVSDDCLCGRDSCNPGSPEHIDIYAEWHDIPKFVKREICNIYKLWLGHHTFKQGAYCVYYGDMTLPEFVDKMSPW